ncbi:Uncharacterised protein [Vibrio cholerae]|nr:Uncharacterised protein [Vibrio cholerae]
MEFPFRPNRPRVDAQHADRVRYQNCHQDADR